MTGDPVGLLIQGGLIGIFMLYVILTRRDDAKERKERDAAWQNFMAEQNKTTCTNMETLAEVMGKLVDKFDAHEKKADSTFAVLLDRIKITPRKLGQ